MRDPILNKEQELTDRAAIVINSIQVLDDYTNYKQHADFLLVAKELVSIIREYNQLVKYLQEREEKDQMRLPELLVAVKEQWEN